LAIQQLFPLTVCESQRDLSAGHPARHRQGVRLGQVPAQIFPGRLGHLTLDVVVSGHQEQTLHRQSQAFHQRVEEIRGPPILGFPAPIGDVTGEAQQVRRAALA